MYLTEQGLKTYHGDRDAYKSEKLRRGWELRSAYSNNFFPVSQVTPELLQSRGAAVMFSAMFISFSAAARMCLESHCTAQRYPSSIVTTAENV